MAGPASVDPAVPAQAETQGGQTGGEREKEPNDELGEGKDKESII